MAMAEANKKMESLSKLQDFALLLDQCQRKGQIDRLSFWKIVEMLRGLIVNQAASLERAHSEATGKGRRISMNMGNIGQEVSGSYGFSSSRSVTKPRHASRPAASEVRKPVATAVVLPTRVKAVSTKERVVTIDATAHYRPDASKDKPKAIIVPIVEEALDFVWNLDTEGIFKYPITKKSAPEIYESYVKLVPVPMDFSSMRQHAQKGDYRHLGSFEEDLMRIFKNCRKFNGVDSWFVQYAGRINKQWKVRKEWLQDKIEGKEAPPPPKEESVGGKRKAPGPTSTSSGSSSSTSKLSKPSLAEQEEDAGEEQFDASVVTFPYQEAYDGIKAEGMSPKEKNRSLMRYIWRYFRDLDREGFFATAVRDDIAPGYSATIKSPMDLSLIEVKINKKYKTVLVDFDKDVKLMVDNCFLYNKFNTKSAVYYAASVLDRSWSALKTDLVAMLDGTWAPKAKVKAVKKVEMKKEVKTNTETEITDSPSAKRIKTESGSVSAAPEVLQVLEEGEDFVPPPPVEWVQCSLCDKWRTLPAEVDVDTLPEEWFCSMNTYNDQCNTCDSEQEPFNDNPFLELEAPPPAPTPVKAVSKPVVKKEKVVKAVSMKEKAPSPVTSSAPAPTPANINDSAVSSMTDKERRLLERESKLAEQQIADEKKGSNNNSHATTNGNTNGKGSAKMLKVEEKEEVVKEVAPKAKPKEVKQVKDGKPADVVVLARTKAAAVKAATPWSNRAKELLDSSRGAIQSMQTSAFNFSGLSETMFDRMGSSTTTAGGGGVRIGGEMLFELPPVLADSRLAWALCMLRHPPVQNLIRRCLSTRLTELLAPKKATRPGSGVPGQNQTKNSCVLPVDDQMARMALHLAQLPVSGYYPSNSSTGVGVGVVDSKSTECLKYSCIPQISSELLRVHVPLLLAKVAAVKYDDVADDVKVKEEQKAPTPGRLLNAQGVNSLVESVYKPAAPKAKPSGERDGNHMEVDQEDNNALGQGQGHSDSLTFEEQLLKHEGCMTKELLVALAKGMCI